MSVVDLIEDPGTGAGAQRALESLLPGADVEARPRLGREAEAMARVDDQPDGGLSPLAGEDGISRVTFAAWSMSWLNTCAASAGLEP